MTTQSILLLIIGLAVVLVAAVVISAFIYKQAYKRGYQDAMKECIHRLKSKQR